MIGSGGFQSPLWSKFTVLKQGPINNANGLIGWFPCTSPTADEISGAGKPLSKTGAPPLEPGLFGNAVRTNGSSTALTGATFSAITTKFTVMAWIYKIGTGGQTVMCQSNAALTLNTFQYGVGPPFGQSSISVGGTNNGITLANWDTNNLNSWHHGAFVYDGANMIHYIDGVLDVSSALTGTPDQPGANSFAIGRIPGGSFGLNGRVNDVRVYNRALPAAEINSIYRSGLVYGALFSEGEMPAMRSLVQNPFMNYDWPVPYGPIEV